MSSPIEPGRASLESMCSMAALTAPHFVWPRTMMSLAPSTATANSMLPFTVGPRATDDVARHADHEQIADPLIEDQFGCHSRVSAADDDGKGRLPLREGREVRGRPSGVDELAADEPLVALEQMGENDFRIAIRGRLARGPSGRGECQPGRTRCNTS